MRAILQILEKAGGWHHGLCIKINNPPYKELVIEAMDESGPCGLPAISVRRYSEVKSSIEAQVARQAPVAASQLKGAQMTVGPAVQVP